MPELQAREAVRAHMKKQFGLTTEQIDSMLPSFMDTLARYLEDLGTHFATRDQAEVGRVATVAGTAANLLQPDLGIGTEDKAPMRFSLGAAFYPRGVMLLR
jgi:hypothetical protein